MAPIINKEIQHNLERKYHQAKLLLDQRDANPKSLQLKSEYASRDLLVEIQDDLLKELSKYKPNTNENQWYTYMLGCIFFKIGEIFFTMKEFITAKKYLKKCLALLDPWKQQPECLIASLNSMILLVSINFEVFDTCQAVKYVEQAEDLHWRFKKSGLVPLLPKDLFCIQNRNERDKDEEIYNLKGCFLRIILFMKRIFDVANPEDHLLDLQFKTLDHQLDFDKDYYLNCMWTLPAIMLAEHLSIKSRFVDSRHILAAAQYTLDKNENRTDSYFNDASINLIRTWASYGKRLLQSFESNTAGKFHLNLLHLFSK